MVMLSRLEGCRFNSRLSIRQTTPCIYAQPIILGPLKPTLRGDGTLFFGNFVPPSSEIVKISAKEIRTTTSLGIEGRRSHDTCPTPYLRVLHKKSSSDTDNHGNRFSEVAERRAEQTLSVERNELIAAVRPTTLYHK